ncbi:ArsR/SmtB family transcription factor [Pluralibacter gergoviae]|uniref:ArsR/SmtB family transcription factor n=1 Tax=Pluralibacter gergoviae TaxID=61647 RepID=UPI0006520CCC|nr:metalloregulator ArsR/SmtB family transcription factor [Pluralibacter gergoviae]EKT9639221.1 winged helix-turn-helix transcriptional regulator [Pluralibacter gergoviae]EKV3544564.1 winged helix-turn-helix transcriptional regulator [Pluralibacter gergoviae]EKV9898747.1 winged helix-turn-helix transcriptional regulator [Pluralibacter gergoviae]EKV9929571.1 winged helix-turn-helix transcriptional regulator [Pluralibacter gergoviae]EKW9975051.1 winged helix-turn-helix transcriptional regulator 
MNLKSEAKQLESGPEADVTALAAAIADASRVKMLCALMDGRAWTATELAAAADIAASTASAHLQKLVQGRLLMTVAQGRHRYFRLAGPEVAQLLESMMGLSQTLAGPLRTRTPAALREARTCYDHLAGTLAVGLYQAMIDKGWLAPDGNALTEEGLALFARLGIELNPATRRAACCPCLDWSERRFHLGGAAGAALLLYFERQGWLTRTSGYREVAVTAAGRRAMKSLFSV